MSAAIDEKMMRRAVELARNGLYSCDPNPRVGCVIEWNGEMLGEGWHARAGEAHAEIAALAAAGASARDATVYVTLEPCCHHGRTPPCVDALIEARVARVVIAMKDPNKKVAGGGIKALKKAGIKVECGLLKEDAAELNRGFIHRCETGRPRVTLKMAASLDGRTAMKSGESRWITSEASRADVHLLRAQSSAIITGSGTMIADDPSLTARHVDGAEYERQPMRVIVDSTLRTPSSAKCFQLPGRTIIATVVESGPAWQPYEDQGVELFCMPDGDKVDLDTLISTLGDMECNDVMIEAGACLAGAFLHNNLVDSLSIYLAPKFMGSHARGMFHMPGVDALSDSVDLSVTDITRVGDDIRITAELVRDGRG